MASAELPVPRSHSAMCSSSNTIVPPRGVTCAKPLGNTEPTRHTLAGKAVSMCDCRIFGILAIGMLPVPQVDQKSQAIADELADRLDEMGQIGAQPVEAGQPVQRALVHIERAVDLYLQAVAPLAGPAVAAHQTDPGDRARLEERR